MPILTAKEVIERLTKYDENEELLITWWTSKFIDDRFECGEYLEAVMDAGDEFIDNVAIGFVNDIMEEALEEAKEEEAEE